MGVIRRGYRKAKHGVHRLARTASPTYRLYDNWRNGRRKQKMKRRIRERERHYQRARHQ